MSRRIRAELLIFVLLAALPLVAQHPSDSRFLLISDIHFNPMADAALVPELQKADPPEWEAILNRTAPAKFSQYGSDTNWWLLQSALKQFPRTLPYPVFVMVTGDFLAHEFPATFRAATHDDNQQHYAAFVLKTVQFLALQLEHAFPGVKVLITPGNDDNDCGDYSIDANGAFLDSTAAVARGLAGGDDEFARSWKSLGSFNVPHPTLSDVRIVSLNSIFLSQKYQALDSSKGCTPISSTAATDLLAWLDKSLAAAAEANQKVWLMMHMPPGIDGYASATGFGENEPHDRASSPATCASSIVPMWVPEWTEQFDALLAKYHATILAGFAGHTHSDDFRLIGSGAERKFILVDPAISPVYKQNPSFRVVEYRSDGVVTDQSTYYLTNLATAKNHANGRWTREYSYDRKWKARQLDSQSLGSVYAEVVSNEKRRNEWLKLYAVSGPAEEGEKSIVRGLYCAVEGLTVESYRECYCGVRKP